ncbi:MAG: replication initiator protein A [Rubrobacter sp.]|nr:replication initiator protein A [Rubrobacter sp.]
MSDPQIPLLPEYCSQVSTEQNLEEYPLFELKARRRGSKARVFERSITGDNGLSFNQVWKVMPSGEYGMPGPVDQDVYLAVLQLLQQRGGMPENGELRFSLYELRKVLRWTDDSGKAYKQIRDSLLRIATTSVQSKQAFYSAHEKRRITDTFTVWSVHFAEQEVDGLPVRERHVLRFHPIFIRNYIAQYLKGLDADFYWSLRSPLSKRLYRLVDLQRAGGISWKTDIFAVRDQVPLHYAYPSQIKRALHKTHEELEHRGFLSGVSYEGKTGVLYSISREFARRQKARELSGDPEEMFTIERIIREGLHGDVARDLVVRHGTDRCLRYADALNSQSGIRSRAGWLRKAIEHGYELPEPPQLPGTSSDASSSSLVVESNNDHNASGSESQPLCDAPVIQELECKEECLSSGPTLDSGAIEAWEALVADLVALQGRESLPPWFDQLEGGHLEDATLTVLVPNSTAANHLNDHFGADLVGLWCRHAGADAVLQVATDLAGGKRALLTG